MCRVGHSLTPHSLTQPAACCCCSAPSLAGTVYCALAKLDIGVQVAVVVEEGEVASGDGGRREHNHFRGDEASQSFRTRQVRGLRGP